MAPPWFLRYIHLNSRKSKEEISRLKLHREQQTALLLEKQRKSAEQNQKMAEDYLIANQVC